MNRRGTVLITTLLALLLAGALATTALAAARLRWLAGLRATAAARATLTVDRRLRERIAALSPAEVDLLPAGVPVGLGAGDTVVRLGPGLIQVRVMVEERTVDGGLLARDGAAQVIVIQAPAAAALQAEADTVDGIGSGEMTIRVVRGGWWRLP